MGFAHGVYGGGGAAGLVERVRPHKVISGGQWGADIAGLRAAQRLNIPTGGWMPKGFRVENGFKPEYAELYGMLEHSSADYPPRTKQNIQESDGTLVFGRGNERGTGLTLRLCARMAKPSLLVYWHWGTPMSATHEADLQGAAKKWLTDHAVKVLNVAGNRESVNYGIEKFVENFCLGRFYRVG